jgi:uncharacterized protein YuzE
MHYDRVEDILYFAFKKGKAHEVVEGSDGQSIIELDSNGNVIGLELWNAKERKILETLESIVKER